MQLYDDNPYTHRAGETSEKIVFKGLPFEFQNYHITEFLKQFSQVEPRSNILFAREKNQDNELFSPYLNGERYIFVKYSHHLSLRRYESTIDIVKFGIDLKNHGAFDVTVTIMELRKPTNVMPTMLIQLQ